MGPFVTCLIVLVFGILLGYCCAKDTIYNNIQNRAIKRNLGRFNPRSGFFEMKDEDTHWVITKQDKLFSTWRKAK